MINKLTLNKTQQNKVVHNALVFLAPVGILYLTTVIGVISVDGHLFSLMDFVPNATARGGFILWILNSALDYLRKLQVV